MLLRYRASAEMYWDFDHVVVAFTDQYQSLYLYLFLHISFLIMHFQVIFCFMWPYLCDLGFSCQDFGCWLWLRFHFLSILLHYFTFSSHLHSIHLPSQVLSCLFRFECKKIKYHSTLAVFSNFCCCPKWFTLGFPDSLSLPLKKKKVFVAASEQKSILFSAFSLPALCVSKSSRV